MRGVDRHTILVVGYPRSGTTSWRSKIFLHASPSWSVPSASHLLTDAIKYSKGGWVGVCIRSPLDAIASFAVWQNRPITQETLQGYVDTWNFWHTQLLKVKRHHDTIRLLPFRGLERETCDLANTMPGIEWGVKCAPSFSCKVSERPLVQASYMPSKSDPLTIDEQRIRRSNLPNPDRHLLLADAKKSLLEHNGEGMRHASSISDQLHAIMATQAP